MDRPTILNVDDYAPGRYARTQLLRGWGFDVKEAATGAEALRLAALEHPALIILDVQLPDMDGFEVCRRLKQHHDGATLPQRAADRRHLPIEQALRARGLAVIISR